MNDNKPNRDDVPEGMKSWIEFAKWHKDWAVDRTERGDIPPIVIVERDGQVQAIIMAPQIDKYLGLQAAAMSQCGYDPDAITMVMDAHIGTMTPERKEGDAPFTDDELKTAEAEFRKKYPKGMQAACDEEGACETGEITDCLICHRIDREGKISIVTLPYAYHGKDKEGKPYSPFKWLDQEEKYKRMLQGTTEEADGLQLKGLIPDALRKIMKTPQIFDAIPALKELQEHVKDFTPERIRFHVARAIMSLMAAKKFIVMDFLSGTHPEWTGAKEEANAMLSRMLETGFIPKEAYEPMKAIIDAHIGTKQFVPTMTALLTANGYWLPAEPRGDIERFVTEWETICMSPNIPDGFGLNDEDDKPNTSAAHGEGKRVRVWNGDRSEYLGEGNYVGNTSVYIIQMEDGSLQSNSNAETEPQDVPEGGVVRKINNNPKIVLDNGQTVYGCQVWWEPVEQAPDGSAPVTSASPHQHHPGCKHNHA